MDAETRPRRTLLGTVAADWASSRRVTVQGRRVRYRAAGTGPPVVLVHGLGVSADYWVRNAPVIGASGFRVLAPDLPGFGKTDGPVRGLSVPEQADAILAWARVMELGPAVYVGHSLSCQAILEIAANHPAEVRGLILAAPTGQGPSIGRLVRQGFGFLRDIRHESLKLSALITEAYLRAGPLRVLRTWRMGARHDPLLLLPRVTCPTLIILGELDPVVSPDFAEAIAAGIPGGRVAVVPRGSHGVIFDKTGRFNQEVVGFLRQTW